jgi:hypothetical protein
VTPGGYKGGVGVSSLDQARHAVLRGDTTNALLEYQRLASTTSDAQLAGEYAYALALDGHADAAFQAADRARQMDPTNAAVWYYTSRILALTGHESLSTALWTSGHRGAPAWIAGKTGQAEAAFKGGRGVGRSYGTKDTERFARANALAAQHFYVSAAVAFENHLASKPDDAAAHAGYSIILEKLGAYAMAAHENDRAKELIANRKIAEVLAKRSKELKEKARESSGRSGPPQVADASPKGRWLLYGGGQFNTGSTTTQTTISGRVGKFITSFFDAGVNVDYVDTPAVKGVSPAASNTTFGVSARLTPPLPMGGNLIVGGRVAFASAGSGTTGSSSSQNGSTLSLGLAKRNPNGEMDLTVDFGSGLYKGTGMTLGYTVYLGGR